jgi:hypothetical protein
MLLTQQGYNCTTKLITEMIERRCSEGVSTVQKLNFGACDPETETSKVPQAASCCGPVIMLRTRCTRNVYTPGVRLVRLLLCVTADATTMWQVHWDGRRGSEGKRVHTISQSERQSRAGTYTRQLVLTWSHASPTTSVLCGGHG